MKKINFCIFIMMLSANTVSAQVRPLNRSGRSTASSPAPTTPSPIVQSTYSGVSVIIGFDMYSNKGLFTQLVDEADNIMTVIFPDDGTICRIDKNGNVLEGESYLKQKGEGKPIVYIQVYEKKKKIVNPALDINKNLSNFMLVETTGGNVFFGWHDYKKEDQSFVFRSKPSSNVILLKPENGKWLVTSSSDPRIKAGSILPAVYLYTNDTRRFYTKK